ncbi:MAG TPA: hypothetical protein VN519_04810 [Bryobacteraceae bacterium]|nr:hypothetical protein [Bryobacteraceae bacterium]
METILETLNAKLQAWEPETANEVRERLTEIIALADQDVLDLMKSRERAGSPGHSR